MAKQLTIPSVVNQEYEQVSVGLIKPHSRNVNQGDKGKIYQSIQDNGFYGACVVQKSTRLILAGSHRWEAAKQAGMPAVPVIWADVDDDAAIRIMLSDNATARAGNDNPNALAELLAELAGSDKGLSGTGFDGDDLDQIINDLSNPLVPTNPANDPNAEWEGMPEYQHGDERPFRSLNVHFDSLEDVQEFGKLIGQEITDEAKWLWHPRQIRRVFMNERWESSEP